MSEQLYRKTQLLEKLGFYYAGDKLPNGQITKIHGYWVQNQNDSTDQWFIDQVIFENTYEPVK